MDEARRGIHDESSSHSSRSPSSSIHSAKLFGLLIFAAALLRVGAAFVSSGFDDPHEIYRTLEPIAHSLGFGTRMAWEWTEGILSTLPVRFWTSVTQAASLVLTTPDAQATALRVIFALLGLFPVWATIRLVRWSGGTEKTALLSGLLVAVWPEFVYRSVRLMDYSVEAALFSGALILALTVQNRWKSAAIAAAGAVLGALFFVRFQSGLYFLGIFGVLVFSKEGRWKNLATYTALYAGVIVVLAWYESVLTGQGFLSPFWKYWEFNVIQDGAAKGWGVAPWHRYLSETLKVYGIFLFFPLVFYSLHHRADKRMLGLFWFPFVVYSAIAHKEGRFIWGFTWLLVPLALSTYSRLKVQGMFRRPRSARWVLYYCILLGLVVQGDRIGRRLMTGVEEVRAFSEIGRKLAEDPPTALSIEADPDSVAGGFFLRFRGPICYRYRGREVGTCPTLDAGMIRLVRSTDPSEDVLWSIGGWQGRHVGPTE